jgi:energy-coupling factor transport system ATP-binding protein
MERKTNELSSGEKQKIILASILAMEPRILLLDEPSSQLDPENTKKLNDLLFYLSRKNKTTILLVEHDLNKTKKFDRIIDLKEVQTEPVLKNKKPSVKLGKIILKTENLCYDYGARPALHGINLEVREGEFISIIGPNGSGKTTLLKHFNGLLKPKKGTVYVDGIDAKNKSVEELARKVGFLSQNPNDYLFSDTVADELNFTLRNFGIKGDVDQTLKEFNLYEHKNHYPRDLSGGERQRVALASILVAKPGIVVLDEPTRGIDLNSRIELTNMLYTLQSKGTAILVATHDLKLAANSQRVIKLEEGRVIKDKRNLK